VRRGEVQMEARPLREPAVNSGCLVGRVVVEDDVNLRLSRGVRFDVAKELEEFSSTVAREALSEHATGGDIERREESRGAVTIVVVRSALDLADAHREHGLRAVQRLDLRLLVDAEDQGVVWRAHVEADDVAYFLNEHRVA